MSKAFAVLFLAILATVVAARLVFEATAEADPNPSHSPWVQGKMEFVTWNDQRWTTTVRDGAFELVPQNTNNWSRHSNSTIAYIDWDGEPWQAKIDGDSFLLAHRGDWSAEIMRASAVRYRDWQEGKQLRTVTQLTR